MLLNLFEIFDPIRFNEIPLNWFIVVFILLFWPNRVFRLLRFSSSPVKVIVRFIFQPLKFSNYSAKWVLILPALLLLAGAWNSTGLLPWVFTVTRHFIVPASIAFTAWVAWLTATVSRNTTEVIASLTPQKISFRLAIFLVLIETVRLMIRPLTLSLRLIANIIAGHLILTLLTEIIIKVSLVLSVLRAPLTFLILLLEIAVALIQRYVFITLLALYLGKDFEISLNKISFCQNEEYISIKF